MNIFLFDCLDLKHNAECHPDKLLVKMMCESSQLINNHTSQFGSPLLKGDGSPFKQTHKHHPSSIWAGESRPNLMYLIHYLEALYVEYKTRYKKKSATYLGILEQLETDFSYSKYDILPKDFIIVINDDWLKQIVDDQTFNLLKINKNRTSDLELVSYCYQNYLYLAKQHYFYWKHTNQPFFQHLAVR